MKITDYTIDLRDTTTEQRKKLAKLLTRLGQKLYHEEALCSNTYRYYYIRHTSTSWAGVVEIYHGASIPLKDFMEEFGCPKKPWKPSHGELVWCWDNDYTHRQHLCIYDRTGTYGYSGLGSNIRWDNYAKYKGKVPKRMRKVQEAVLAQYNSKETL